MKRRRRFSGDLKAKVALEALRGDRTLQEIASKHQVHPNQVSTWKRQAIEGLGEVFSNGVDRRRRDHDSEVHELHAKIGELTVERDFLSRGLLGFGAFITGRSEEVTCEVDMRNVGLYNLQGDLCSYSEPGLHRSPGQPNCRHRLRRRTVDIRMRIWILIF